MIVTLSFDVEEFDFPLERGRQIDLDTQLAVSTQGLEAVLEMLQRLNIKATFYTTANFASHRTELIRSIAAAGHEIASHDFYHAPDSTLMPIESRSKLEALLGIPIHGYRAPRLATASPEQLSRAGYRYNSSINPTWIPGRYNNLRAPRSISQTPEGLRIYPTSVSYPLRIPLFWLSLHVMPLWLYRMLAKSALRQDGHLNLYFHPWEFSDRLTDPAFGVPGYLSHCSGGRLLAKLENLSRGLLASGCRFETTRQYLGCDD